MSAMFPELKIKVIPEEDLKKLKDEFAKQTKLRPRLVMLFKVGLGTGLRISEILSLMIEDMLEIHDNGIKKVSVRDAITVRCKGNKTRQIVLSDNLRQEMLDYIMNYRKMMAGPMFARNNGTARLTRQRINQEFNELEKAALLSCHITPHCMRHTFASWVAETTGNEWMVMKLMGHSDPRISAQYVTFSKEKLRHVLDESVQKKMPLLG